jgi:hypothetical protein
VVDAKLEEIRKALEAELGGSTPLSRALALAVERLIHVEPDAWLVQGDGPVVVVYLLRGAAVHEIQGERPFEASRDELAPPPTTTSGFSYRVIRLTPEAKVTCQGKQKEDANGRTQEFSGAWQFVLDPECTIKIETGSPLLTQHDAFAASLVGAIEATYAQRLLAAQDAVE